jgi:hypothetical protein
MNRKKRVTPSPAAGVKADEGPKDAETRGPGEVAASPRPRVPSARPATWRGVKRVWRLALLHALAVAADGHAWNALALTAVAGTAALPAELLSAHAWLRTAVPIALAAVGVLTRTAARASEIADKT